MHSLDSKNESFAPAWMKGGHRIVYYMGEENRCPGCGRKSWKVGRLMAECAYCETAIPLQMSHGYGASPRFFTAGPALRSGMDDEIVH